MTRNLLNNNKGSLLVLTVGFALIFTMLGLAALYAAGLQNQMAEKLKASNQAFWLAEAGIESTRTNLPATPEIDSPSELGNGNYTITSFQQISSSKWQVTARGSVNSFANLNDTSSVQERNIQAQVALVKDSGITDAIVYEGPQLKCKTSSTGTASTENCAIIVDGTIKPMSNGLDLNTIFPGLTEDNLSSAAAASTGAQYDYTTYTSNEDHPIKGVTVIDLTTAGASQRFPTITINTDYVQGTPFVYIEAYNPLDPNHLTFTPTIKIEGSKPFTGLLWVNVKQKATVTQKSGFQGTMFLEGDTNNISQVGIEESDVESDPSKKIKYDKIKIDDAVSNLADVWYSGGFHGEITDWKEI